jgi:RimJ/RimL family protein N-acetyltransferase
VLLFKCEQVVEQTWGDEVRALTPAERLDFDMERILLKVDAENTDAVRLYKRMGYMEVARVPEELMVPQSSTQVHEWPVLNIYMKRDMCSFNLLKSLIK